MKRTSSVKERLENLRRYAEELASGCNCEELMMDDDPCGALCPWCEEQMAPPPAPSIAEVFSVEIAFIRDKVEQISRTKSKRLRVKIIREVFTALLGCQGLLAPAPIFRAAVVNKLAEFRTQPLACSLLPLFDQTDAMLATLPARPDYKV